MLGISSNSDLSAHNISVEKLKSYDIVKKAKMAQALARSLTILATIFAIFIFLPWTQSVRTKGYVTTLTPGKRPQKITSIISGRIEKWYVHEGDFVNKGDTILLLSEIKDDYFDPQLLDRTQKQIENKSFSLENYKKKIFALENQILALNDAKQAKETQAKNYIRQARLLVHSDSTQLMASITNNNIALKQFDRTNSLYQQG